MGLERGTIVYADDPFKGADAGRPWLVCNTSQMPFAEQQSIALTLTTKTWYDERICIAATDVVDGELPRSSSILPWAIASIERDAIDERLARVAPSLVDEAILHCVSYLGLDPTEWR
ncbi:type II toxin-antitoxin system PemK/MazF family toxin [Halovivax limisalsi]|uniref:type II toxin-antitoxin system PemK/MazF family toxin n=1 Tax=Halovivax limisalsi TaxID=1453760 RepID=UPI001FFC7F4D|nr:type II toxin-antitoxin system PemK/MazF family toxin [Halovivax limisalsi]